jgi:hypothetical protein
MRRFFSIIIQSWILCLKLFGAMAGVGHDLKTAQYERAGSTLRREGLAELPTDVKEIVARFTTLNVCVIRNP